MEKFSNLQCHTFNVGKAQIPIRKRSQAQLLNVNHCVLLGLTESSSVG